MISVIMPVFNAEKYLDLSIKSILNQSYRNLELIIIDDGSKDKSFEIIKKYEKIDQRIRVISRSNKGLVKTLNEGINIARGKYFTRMDADDISDINRIEKQRDFLEKNKNIDMLGSYYNYIGDCEDIEKKNLEKEFELIKNYTGEELIIGCGHSICHPSFFCRLETIKRINGYNENFKIAEDLALQISLLEQKKNISLIKEKLIFVRKHKFSKSSIEKNENAIETMKLRLNYINSRFISNKKSVLLWGASTGGLEVKEYIDNNLEKIEILAFIDSYNYNRVLGEKKVIKPEKIKNYKFDYIFICTSPGRLEVQEYLLNEDFKPIKNYFSIYT